MHQVLGKRVDVRPNWKERTEMPTKLRSGDLIYKGSRFN
jgi:hypothetical protein